MSVMANHQVKVRATKSPDGTVHFEPKGDVWTDPKDGKPGHMRFDKSKIMGMKKSDKHYVDFVLDDETGLGLQFPADGKKAFWVKKADATYKCPSGSGDCDYSVIWPSEQQPERVHGKKEVFRIVNLNPREEDWVFSLNFVPQGADETDEQQLVKWDPVITNRNGGIG